MEILKQASWQGDRLKLYHFSVHKGKEIDLVIEDKRRRLYGIEVKSTASVKKSDFSGLKKFAEVVGNRFERGIVLYTGTEILGGFGGKNLLAVPVSVLWN